ncbi:MAG: DUF4065 domain-containing protein [Deltaproteobacteria bacterium]|nr:DUF4065 domain-containing protein [Deltaproteobacteria bacterium]
MPTVFDVADYFIVETDRECEGGMNDDVMTHFKVQRLVYFAQGYSLATNGEPLFEEPIEAWEHGPVCPALYDKYKSYGRTPVDSPRQIDEIKSHFSDLQIQVLEKIHEELGCFSSGMLRDISEEDTSWIDARARGGDTMTHEEMKESALFWTLYRDSDEDEEEGN